MHFPANYLLLKIPIGSSFLRNMQNAKNINFLNLTAMIFVSLYLFNYK